MKKSLVVLLHIGFWACYILLVLIIVAVYYRSGLYATGREARVVIALENIFLFAFLPSFLSFYAYYFFLFPKYLQEKKYLLALMVGILTSAGISVLAYILHRYLIESGPVIDMDKAGKN